MILQFQYCQNRNITTPKIRLWFLQHGILMWTKVIYNLHQLRQQWIWNHLFPGMKLIQPETNRIRMRILVHTLGDLSHQPYSEE